MNANKLLTATFIICLVIQIADGYAQNVAINNTGNQANPNNTLEVIGSNPGSSPGYNTKAIYAENIVSDYGGGWSYGIFGKVPSGFGYTIGVRGTSFNNVAQDDGRSYGGLFTAGNAGASVSGGWNYGMYAKLQGSLPGAAVVGFNDKDYDWDGNTNGSWAGYFVGDVNITEDLIVEGTVEANTGWHGSKTMKILPGDFTTSTGNPTLGPEYMQVYSGLPSGVMVPDGSQDLHASIIIPEGYSMDEITVYGTNNRFVVIWEVDITTGATNWIDFAFANSPKTLTNVSSTPTNYIIVSFATQNANDIVYGGIVKLTAN